MFMKNSILSALLSVCAVAASHTIQAQGFIGNGTGNGIQAVNSSGTLSGVNVGIGVATPAAGTTLEVANPGPGTLGLKLDNLPSTTTPYVLYYDGSSNVTYGAAPSGSISALNYDCGVGTFTVNGVTSAAKAWLLSGATTSSSNDYLGTFNNDDIRIATNNNNCVFDPLKSKMLISKDGNVGIGYDGTNLPNYPQNKLLIENGTPLPSLYTYVSGFFGSPQNVGMVAVGNATGSNNVSMAALGIKSGSAGSPVNNMGLASIIGGDYSKNQGVGIYVAGDNSFNVGYEGEVGSGNTNSYNIEYIANTGFDAINSNSIGVGARVGHNSTGSTNIGITDSIFGDGGPLGAGMLVHVEGTPTVTKGISCEIASTGSQDVSGYDVTFVTGSDGSNTNYGVKSDLSAGAPAVSGTVPYYAVYGIAPTGTAAGTGPSSGSNAYMAYAGYFEGDVFCSNNYYYSDPRLKEKISPYTGALEQLSKLPVKRYVFKNEEYRYMNLPAGDQIGVLSTDLKEVFPGLVKPAMHPGGKTGTTVSFEAVNYNALIPVLVQAVKEVNDKADNPALARKVADQQTLINAQAQLLADQGKQIADLRNMLDDLCTNGCAGFSPRGNATAPAAQGAVLYQSVPNPASGTVSIGYAINMPYGAASIRVVTVDDKLISEYKINGQGSGSISFDTNSMATGVYKYYLSIDGKIADAKSMSVSSK